MRVGFMHFIVLIALLWTTLSSWLETQAETQTAFRIAKPSYTLQFPDDHGEHSDFASEWWYTTGHLATANGKNHFGYEATLFRIARPAPLSLKLQSSKWEPQHIYMTHLALSDVSGKHFYYAQAYERQNPYHQTVASAPWELSAKGLHVKEMPKHRGSFNIWQLKVSTKDFRLNLRLVPRKPIVAHGTVNGYSKKGDCPSCASIYYSYTDIYSSGDVVLNATKTHPQEARFHVYGKSWFDHEFGSSQLTEKQVGWDWFAIQLDSRDELMVYRMRERDGGISPQSGGTWIPRAGEVQRLKQDEILVTPLARWQSPLSQAVYPSQWRIEVPKLQLSLTVTPKLSNQELYFPEQKTLSYWEGANFVEGTHTKAVVKGNAYVELAGYVSKIKRF